MRAICEKHRGLFFASTLESRRAAFLIMMSAWWDLEEIKADLSALHLLLSNYFFNFFSAPLSTALK